MNTKFNIEIIINNVINQGTIILSENSLILEVSNQIKELNFNEINSCAIIEMNKINLTLNNGIQLILVSIDYNKIFNYINSKISKVQTQTKPILNIIKNPYISLIVCLVIFLFLGYFVGSNNSSIINTIGPIFSLISYILLIISVISILRIIYSFIKKIKNIAKDNDKKSQIFKAFYYVGTPIMLFIIVMVLVFNKNSEPTSSNDGLVSCNSYSYFEDKAKADYSKNYNISINEFKCKYKGITHYTDINEYSIEYYCEDNDSPLLKNKRYTYKCTQ